MKLDIQNKNIKFNYLYRDAGNYKLFNSIIFTNPDKSDLETIRKKISEALIDGEFFSPEEWNIPRLEFEKPDDDLDHSWHEFESLELTPESSEKMKNIEEFLSRIAIKEDKADSETKKHFVRSGNLRNLYSDQLKEKPQQSTFMADTQKEIKLDGLIDKIEQEQR